MKLDAFKLLFAERPEAPEGVEFWEWLPRASLPIADPDLDVHDPEALDWAAVGLWQKEAGRPSYVELLWPKGVRRIYYSAQEGVLTA